MTRVAIGCPVRDRAWVLPEYLAALNAIDHAPKQYVFLENDCTDGTPQILREWVADSPLMMTRVDGASVGHTRSEYGRDGYAHLAAVRNRFLELVAATRADYLLSIDSDVIVPPDVLTTILPLANQQTIVGVALSNIPGKPLDGRLPGNFLVDRAGSLVHPYRYPLAGAMDVDVTGACCLIPMSAIRAGVRYGPHPQGEDIVFCRDATARGFRIVVTFDVRPEHRMVATC